MPSAEESLKGDSALEEAFCGHQSAVPRTLYVVGTPLGNLGDLTLRAMRILRTCDSVACETPRVTQHLLASLGIGRKPLFTYRDAGEIKSAQHIVTLLQQGKSVALVSDAGIPTISDPGYRLIKLCCEQAIPVVPIPGPCAALTALSVSGFPSQAFLFLGFLPPKSGAQLRLFTIHKTFSGTLILYESPHRIRRLIERLQAFFEPERWVFVAREMTKRNESFYRFQLKNMDPTLFLEKGEYVVLIAPQMD